MNILFYKKNTYKQTVNRFSQKLAPTPSNIHVFPTKILCISRFRCLGFAWLELWACGHLCWTRPAEDSGAMDGRSLFRCVEIIFQKILFGGLLTLLFGFFANWPRKLLIPICILVEQRSWQEQSLRHSVYSWSHVRFHMVPMQSG